ncbi:MAG: hypothetical protein KatS3mg111_4060 [Pirellulaceae bacterium]|nr:MAG: hypothetical protein KatS3mg111_4060 [Pirellulaceae bacterium]
MQQQFAWTLILIGLSIAIVGLLWLLIPHIGWLGRLPGDIRIENENVRIYIPITTSLLLSMLLTGLLWLLSWMGGAR